MFIQQCLTFVVVSPVVCVVVSFLGQRIVLATSVFISVAFLFSTSAKLCSATPAIAGFGAAAAVQFIPAYPGTTNVHERHHLFRQFQLPVGFSAWVISANLKAKVASPGTSASRLPAVLPPSDPVLPLPVVMDASFVASKTFRVTKISARDYNPFTVSPVWGPCDQ